MPGPLSNLKILSAEDGQFFGHLNEICEKCLELILKSKISIIIYKKNHEKWDTTWI